MLGENKNLKDQGAGEAISLMDSRFFISYTKTNKLITALYMVTDVLEDSEPIRHRLRTLGIEVISDISVAASMSLPSHRARIVLDNNPGDISRNLDKKVHEILSLLEIAFSLRMISEMNHGILRKEFMGLRQSIREVGKDPTILDLLNTEDTAEDTENMPGSKGFNGSIGHGSIGHERTRIGVQKGSTLLNALSKVQTPNSNFVKASTGFGSNASHHKNDFVLLKNKRRDEIIAIIKDMKKRSVSFEGASIKDIALALKSLGEEWGEKTLQRELVAMASMGLISKNGSKRWSRYSLN